MRRARDVVVGCGRSGRGSGSGKDRSRCGPGRGGSLQGVYVSSAGGGPGGPWTGAPLMWFSRTAGSSSSSSTDRSIWTPHSRQPVPCADPPPPIYTQVHPPHSELTFPNRVATPPTTTPTILTTSRTNSVSFVIVPYQLATKSRTTSASSAHTCRSISALAVSGGSRSSSGVDGGASEHSTRRISASVGLSSVAVAAVVSVDAGGVAAALGGGGGGGGEGPAGRYPGMGGRADVMA